MANRLTANTAPTAKPAENGIERELTAAAQRIRWQDGLTGLAGIAVLLLAYAVTMVLLDRWLVLPQWVRQLGFAGFLTSVGTVAYFFIVRPLQKSVNPRYIARQLEGTQAETKNELINWVDMREKEIPGSIRAAVDARAAEGLAEADVNTAIRSGKIAWLGGAAMVLVGVLAVLFLVFKASQFTSLLGRAFNPFQSAAIVSRTTLELVEPEPADATITDGEQLRFLVRVVGKKPTAEGPDRVRLLLKQGQDETQYEEIPFTPTANGRESDLVLGRSTIRNGFWYKVAGGDAETAEHRINIRTRPLISAFEARYEYPAYTRMVPDIGREPKIEAHRGTAVTLTVKTNRQLKSGSISFDGKPVPVAGEVVADAKDSLRFRFKLEERTNYCVQFTSTDNESSGPSPAYPIDVLQDREPTVLIDAPGVEEIPLSVNGQLAVDGIITDDFGLENATLVLRIPNEKGIPAEIRKRYIDGASLKREKDGIHPTSLKYKDSIKLDALKTEAGAVVALKPETVVEYWLEATDNCTEPKANLGKSAVKRIKLTLPPMAPEQKKEQERKAGERRAEEQNQQQGEKQNREKGKPQKPPQRPDRVPEKKDEPENTEPGEAGMDKPPPDMGVEKPNEPNGPKKGEGQPDPKDLQKKADDLQRKLDEKNKEGADTKANPDQGQEPMGGEEPKPGDGKPKNEKSDPGKAAEPKTGDPQNGAGEQKEPGKVQPPGNSKEKPAPDEKAAKPEDQPQADKDKQEPRGGESGGQEKSSQPKDGSPMEQQPKGGEPGEGKNAQPKPEEGKQPDQKPTEGAGKTKPDGQPKSSEEKASPKPEDQQGGTGEEKAEPKEQPGGAKNQKPTESGGKKAGPKEPPMGSEPGSEKKPPEEGMEKSGAGNEKGAGQDSKTPPMGSEAGKEQPKGSEKSSKPTPGKGDKPDSKEIENAIKDLDSKDPQKQQDARDKLDKTVGKSNREKAEQLKKDLKSDDKAKRDAAQGELQRLADENGEKQKRDPQAGDADQLQRDAEDLASNDDQKRQGAEQRLDEKIGKEKRDELQKKSRETKKDRESGDPKKQDAAKKELGDLAKQAGGHPQDKAKDLTPEQVEQFKKDAKDLASKDDKTRQDAEKRLDEKIGKENREAAQKKAGQLEKDLQSDDPAKKAAAEKELQDLAKQAGEQAKKQDGKPGEPTPEQVEQFKKDAEGLASKDDKTRKEAEQKLDQQIGKENRENLQKDLKDLAGNDPEKAKEAKERIEQRMEEQAKKQAERKQETAGNGGKGQDGRPLEENKANRIKTAELQLDNFKSKKGNKEFLKESNMTEAEFEKFLKGYEEMIAKMKDDVEAAKLNPPGARPPGPTTVGGNDAGGTRVEGKPNATGVEGPGGSGVAPPGFNEAQNGFVVPRRPKK